ncbi:MAG: hypothetical protein DRG83_06120 [Deltaproteobacteria bacterium]|nr:MAG: hypothetical protein DRG83_06120 [Deltaproteobacteria bacterium]
MYFWKRLRLVFGIAFFWFFLLAPLNAMSQVFYVSPDGSENTCSTSNPCSLQTALNLSSSNGQEDTIYLMAGTYVTGSNPFTYSDDNHSENFPLSIEAQPGLSNEQVVLDGESSTQVLYVLNSWYDHDAADFTLKSITIRNGRTSSQGGGLYVWVNGDIKITDCIFDGNTGASGGGIYLVTSNHRAYVFSCDFRNNTASDGEGGGILASALGPAGELFVQENLFTDNTSKSNGGGASLIADGTLFVERNHFTNNKSTSQSGGALFVAPQTTCKTFLLNANTFFHNSSHYYGAGTYCMENALQNCKVIICNNIWAENTGINGANIGGGGLYYSATQSAQTHIINNTFANNYGTWGEELYLAIMNSDTSVTVSNNIFWKNGEYYSIYIWSPDNNGKSGSAYGYYNDYAHVIRQYDSTIFRYDTAAWDGSDGNLYVNPAFVDASNKNYRLSDTSPCIDSGTISESTVSMIMEPLRDADGKKRVIQCVVDMGAYEHGDYWHIGDYNDDGDIDGEDLATFAKSIYVTTLTDKFAVEYGHHYPPSCPH